MGRPILLQGEEWRAIDGYEGLYEVSSLGRVRSLDRVVLCKRTPGLRRGIVLKPIPDKDGYPRARLCRDGGIADFKVHQLVCRAFNGPPPRPGMEVRHDDGDPSNNRPGNLFWGTALENAADRKRHGTDARGEKSVRAKVTQAQADEIRAAHAAAQAGRRRVPRGWLPEMAVLYGVSPVTISCICQGRGYEG